MAAEARFDDNSCRQIDELGRDRAIAQLAARQHGVVARRQLVEFGLSAREVGYRLRIGRLHEVHRGVYAVGHARVTRRGRWMAAVLACGPGAVLSHRDAAALHGIRPTDRAFVDITAPRRRVRAGIDAHRSTLPADELTAVDGIPVTTVARTILDLAAVVPLRHVERAMAEAEHRRLGDPTSLADLLARHPRAKGSGRLRALLATRAHLTTLTRSELEERFLAYVRVHRLPAPVLNDHVHVGGGATVECDAVWRRARVVVELDSREFHQSHDAFGWDRLKSRRLSVAGWQPIRVAAEHLRSPDLAHDLRGLLAQVA